MVLVQAQNPANVGFVARVLANFGVTDWVLLDTAPWRGSEAERTGAPARALLEAARAAATWEEALAGCSHVVGFTARPGRHRQACTLPELPALAAGWGAEARPALVFGREDRGLEAAQTERCGWLASIPTHGLASLNLSHAVALALYEWFRLRVGPGHGPEAPGHGPEAPREGGDERLSWSSAEGRARLAAGALAELQATGFPDGGELEGSLRRLSSRPMEARDLRVLEKILRHAQYLREAHVPRP